MQPVHTNTYVADSVCSRDRVRRPRLVRALIAWLGVSGARETLLQRCVSQAVTHTLTRTVQERLGQLHVRSTQPPHQLGAGRRAHDVQHAEDTQQHGAQQRQQDSDHRMRRERQQLMFVCM